MSILDLFGIRPTIRRALAAPIGKTHILLPAAFLAALGLNILNFGIVFFMSDTFGSSPGEIGTLTALWSLSYFTGCFVLRPLGRKLMPRYSMMIASGSMALWLSAVVVFQSRGVTFIMYGLSGLSNSMFFPPLMTWLSTGVEGVHLNKAMSRFSLAWSLGGVLSPYIAGFLVERNPVYAVIACVSLLAVTCLVIITAALTIRGLRDEDTGPAAAAENLPNDSSTFLRFPAWIGNYSVYVLAGILNAVFPLFVRNELLMKESVIGLIFLLRALLVTAGFVVLGRLTVWHFRKTFLLFVQLALAAVITALLFIRTFTGFLIAVPLQGIVLAAMYSGSVFYGATGAAERQKRMAVHEAVLTAGVVTGSVLGGFVYQQASIKTVFLIVLGIAAAAGAAQAVLLSVQLKKGLR